MVSVEHFLDEMDVNECIWTLRNLAYTDKNLWDATRLRIFSTTSMFSKNKLHLTDILKFPWDKENVEVTIEDNTAGGVMTEEERKAFEADMIGYLQHRDEKEIN